MTKQAAIVERDGSYWRLSVWFETEDEAREAIKPQSINRIMYPCGASATGPTTLPASCPIHGGNCHPRVFTRQLVRRIAAYVRGYTVPPPQRSATESSFWGELQRLADSIEAHEDALIASADEGTPVDAVDPQGERVTE